MNKYFCFFFNFYLCFLWCIGISEESYNQIKHIHFVIYRLKNIIFFNNSFFFSTIRDIPFFLFNYQKYSNFLYSAIRNIIFFLFICFKFYIFSTTQISETSHFLYSAVKTLHSSISGIITYWH
jgi:hypothetical protein